LAIKPAQAWWPSRLLSLHNSQLGYQSVNNFVGLDDQAVKTQWPSWQLSWYTAGDYDHFLLTTEAVFYWLPAPQSQTYI
jgi:hypothetical protein